jgi:tetratricopeptide (TPR) repeat protein
MISLALAVLLACQSGPSQKDEKAIKSAIQDELDGYVKRDHVKWSNQWVHEPYVIHMYIMNGNYHRTVGWDSIEAFAKNHFADTSAYAIEHQKTVLKVQNYGKTAFVLVEEIVMSPGSSNPADSSDVYIYMEKRNGRWLFVDQLIIYKSTFSGTDRTIESNLNISGYQLLWRNKIKEAIEVLKLNAQLFPESFNVYDSLGEAYMKAGEKALAIQNYEKSLKLNPKNTNAVDMLKKLKGKIGL